MIDETSCCVRCIVSDPFRERTIPSRSNLACFLLSDLNTVVFEAEVFLDDASSGLNAVLRSLPWQPQDVMLLTSAAYAVLPNTGKWLQKRYGIQIVQAEVYHGCKMMQAWIWIVWIRLAEHVHSSFSDCAWAMHWELLPQVFSCHDMLLQDEMSWSRMQFKLCDIRTSARAARFFWGIFPQKVQKPFWSRLNELYWNCHNPASSGWQFLIMIFGCSFWWLILDNFHCHFRYVPWAQLLEYVGIMNDEDLITPGVLIGSRWF